MGSRGILRSRCGSLVSRVTRRVISHLSWQCPCSPRRTLHVVTHPFWKKKEIPSHGVAPREYEGLQIAPMSSRNFHGALPGSVMIPIGILVSTIPIFAVTLPPPAWIFIRNSRVTCGNR